jgi:hypothetical protein
VPAGAFASEQAVIVDDGEWERAKLTALERDYFGEHHAKASARE